DRRRNGRAPGAQRRGATGLRSDRPHPGAPDREAKARRGAVTARRAGRSQRVRVRSGRPVAARARDPCRRQGEGRAARESQGSGRPPRVRDGRRDVRDAPRALESDPGGRHRGRRFSQALRGAIAKGYSEPDPREDLSGMDVARKALILGRLLGFPGELKDIAVESLVPPGAERLTPEEFLARLEEYDAPWTRR